MQNGEKENRESMLMQPTNKLARSFTVYKARHTNIYIYIIQTFEKTDNVF